MALSSLINKLQQGADNERSFEDIFLKRFYEGILAINKEEREGYTPSNYYKPSSIWGCERMMFFQRLGEEQDESDLNDAWTYQGIRIMDSGTDAHKRLQKVFQKMAEIDPEMQILDIEELVKDAKHAGRKTEFIGYDEERLEAKCRNSDLFISFQADGAFRFMGKEVIAEIKTTNIYTFNKIKQGIIPREHRIQASCYGYALNVDYVLFIYEDRNFCQHYIELMRVNPQDIKILKNKVEQVEQMVKDRIPPEKNTAGKNCTYCNYKTLCEKVEMGEYKPRE